MEYKSEQDGPMQRKQTYEDKMYTLYALLWEKFAKEMQSKISSGLDYDNLLYNTPIALLREIKEHSLNCQSMRYEMAIILDALLINIHLKKKGW